MTDLSDFWKTSRKVYGQVAKVPGVRGLQDRVAKTLSKSNMVAKAQMKNGQVLYVDFATRGARSLWLRGVFDEVNTAFLFAELKVGDAFLDVGANMGAYTATAAPLVGEQGLVIAVEPNTYTLSLLARSVHENRWSNVSIFSGAASEKTSALGFQGVKDSGLSHVTESGGASTVLGLPLDVFLPAIGDRSIGALKLDVEGHELDALAGMEELFRTHPPKRVLSEAHRGNGKEYVESLFGFFERHGYDAVDPGASDKPCSVDDVLEGTWNVGFIKR